MRIFLICLFAVFTLTQVALSQDLELPDDMDLPQDVTLPDDEAATPQQTQGGSSLGWGLNVGVQKPFCDVLHTGVGPAGEFMVKFLINNRITLSTAIGYGLVNDGFINNTFQTNLITGDLKANINLLEPGKVNPYLTLGLGIFSFEYKKTKSYAIGSSSLEGKRYFDGSFIFGGGMEFMVSPKLAINIFADYRHTTGDALDGADIGSSKDGYLNGRIGFTYYLSPRPVQGMPSEEDLLALEQGEFSEANNEDMLPEGDSDKLSMFEAKIDKLDNAENAFTMEQYVRLKSRVDELNNLIEEKERELDELRASLDLKNQRIADLESAIQKGSSGAVSISNFSDAYEEALRNFYSRNYEEAIRIFTELKNNFPNHKLASNCQYWIGESYFGMGDYAKAAEAFQAVFNYSFSYKKDDATLMLGRCYYNLHDIERAKSYFQGLLTEYPDSEYVEKARQWLSRIG